MSKKPLTEIELLIEDIERYKYLISTSGCNDYKRNLRYHIEYNKAEIEKLKQNELKTF